VLFAYVDESGDGGFLRSPSTHYALGTIVIPSDRWLEALDAVVAFRRHIRGAYGVPMTAELKAQYLLRGGPGLSALSYKQRSAIYHASMEFLATATWGRVFAVVIRKAKVLKTSEKHYVINKSWTFTVERLQSWARSQNTEVLVIHDDGTNLLIRRTLRAMRRFHRAGSYYTPGYTLPAEAKLVVEDPSPRNSRDSYFIQLADLVAYAAVRRIDPTARFGVTAWNLLGPSRIKEVSRLVGGPFGIVAWPR
jgi:hypothetical protein